MELEKIKETILELAHKHQSSDNDSHNSWESESIEQESEQLIIDYAISKGYSVNGFPPEQGTEEWKGEEITHEHYQLYVNTLALEKDDIAELMWHYSSSFWPDRFKSKEEYLEELKGMLESGIMYDVEL